MTQHEAERAARELLAGIAKHLDEALSSSPPSRKAILAAYAELQRATTALTKALQSRPVEGEEVERGQDWFKGEVDCDGNELVTIRADELQKLRDERDKFMWQVRDTCTRAEKAEAAQASTRRDALEEAARVADRSIIGCKEGAGQYEFESEEARRFRARAHEAAIIAAAIRALTSQDAPQPGDGE